MLNFLNQNKKEDNNLQVINLIGKGTSITGNLKCDGDIRIDGMQLGNVTTPGKLVTGSESEINGDIRIGSGKIAGIVKGNIYSTGTLEIEKTARVEGIIESNGLIIQEGADLKAEICSRNKSITKSIENPVKARTSDFSKAAVL